MADGSGIRTAHRGGGVEDYDPREAWPKIPKTPGQQQGLDVLQAELLIRRSLKNVGGNGATRFFPTLLGRGYYSKARQNEAGVRKSDAFQMALTA